MEISSGEMTKVVGDRFCVPYTMELLVKREIQSFSNSHFDILDTNGNVLLRVDGGVWRLQRERVVTDPAGLPVMTLREKGNGKLHQAWKQEWEIHEGESSDSKQFLFGVKRSSGFHIKSHLDVTLASQKTENGCDFRVIGSIASLSMKVRRGNSIIAEVSHRYTWASFTGKEKFKVKISPEVDYAFIVALLVIIQENDT